MKWFIVVLFLLDPNADATADRDIYVFTDPTFESQQRSLHQGFERATREEFERFTGTS